MDNLVNQAWMALLANVVKKRGLQRPGIGDDVDLYLPQSRLLALIQSDTSMPQLLYQSAQVSASRNAYNIVKKLGMPADYFWKFEYWPKARALTTLGQIVKRVFSSMMIQAKEGDLEITGLDIDPLRIELEFHECVECAGIKGFDYGICYYHGGTFAGILSSLINRDLAAFETDCTAHGKKLCRFIVGDKQDGDVKSKCKNYLSPPDFKTELPSRLQESLQNTPARDMGNLVDIYYHQLVLINALLSDPQRIADASFEVGLRLGRTLAPVVSGFFGQEGLQNVIAYYTHLHQSHIEIRTEKPRLELEIEEPAEAAGLAKSKEMIAFLSGELLGLVSGISKTEMTIAENRFEDSKLFLAFVPKA